MPAWGGSAANQAKPGWRWLSKGRPSAAGEQKLANTFADSTGWKHHWPWGDEILVAIGGLSTNLGAPIEEGVTGGVDLATLIVSNVTPGNVAFRLLMDEGLTVNGSPTLIAISNNALLANVTLVYDATKSDPTRGKLVFANTTVALGSANLVANVSLTVNSSSAFQGSLIMDASNNTVSNTLPANLSKTVIITAA